MANRKMSRRHALKTGALGMAASPFAATLGTTIGSEKRPPNIMVIHCHDVGRHLGCYDRGLDTPQIDRLAAEGIRFDRCFSPAPFCSPSRCSRLTGLYPTNHGSIGSSSFAWGIRKGIQTLPMILNEAGYDTHLIGLQHETRDVKTLGYSNYQYGVNSPGAPRNAVDVTPRVLEFLDRHDGSGRPFYMDVGFSEAHMSVPEGGFEEWAGTEAPQRFKPIYVPRSEADNHPGQPAIPGDIPGGPPRREYRPEEVQPLPYLPDRPGIREDLADLNTVITNVIDAAVGRILDKLEEKGLSQDTLVVFTTDHGIDMPRAKGSLYDPGTEVALLMRYPKRFRKGDVHDELLSLVDFLPTILEIAAAVVPQNIDGRSFLPLIEGRPYQERNEVFLENTWHGFYEPMRGIRTKRFKYVRNFDLKRQYWAVESKAAREVLGRVCFGVKPLEELYDLEKDPHEQHNLASSRTMLSLLGGAGRNAQGQKGHPEYVEAVRGLREQLKSHMVRTADPLLQGPIAHQCYSLIWEEG